MQDQQRRVWESRRRREVSVQKTEEVRRRGWGEAVLTGEGGGEAMVGQAHKKKKKKKGVLDHASNVCLSGPVEAESPTGTSGGQISARA